MNINNSEHNNILSPTIEIKTTSFNRCSR